jgi:aryl-alcohol dehydrogenase-like predicted oxidoreductase
MSGGNGAEKLAGGARRMGQTGMTVSRLGYGAMELAGPPKARDLSESQVARFLNELLDRGVNYIDTSIDYGLSETLIGKTLAHRRDEFFLASKCACAVGGEPGGDFKESHIYTGANVTAGVEQSLQRLRTDHLDVVQVHGDPTLKELEDGGVIEALLALQKKGMVRHLGISTRLPLLAQFVDVAAFSVVQLPYSALQRQNETHLAKLKQAGKAIVARGVTGRGAPAKSWATRPIGMSDGQAKDLWARAELGELIGDMPPVEFMIRFALSEAEIDVCLVATTDADHLAADIDYAARGKLEAPLYAEARRRLDAAGGGAGQGEYQRGGPSKVA